jgi:quinol monooxygenase YgiN
MSIVLVYAHVKPDYVEAFKTATLENAKMSVKEPGIERFELYQEKDNPTHFTLLEIYRTSEAPASHKETAHYLKWRDTVSDMMEEPRKGVWHEQIFPTEQ